MTEQHARAHDGAAVHQAGRDLSVTYNTGAAEPPEQADLPRLRAWVPR